MRPDSSASLKQAEAPRMMAVLFVQRFRLQAALLSQGASEPPCNPRLSEEASPHPWSSAVGLVEPHSTKGLLLEVSPCAESFGVEAGMAPAQAMARCPHLQLVSASERSEQRLTKALLNFAGSLSPRVEKQANNRYLLDLRGFRIQDWGHWAENAIARLRLEHSLSGVIGVAPRAGLAWCAAKRAFPVKVVEHPESFMEELTIEELEVSSQLHQQLTDWGMRTLGELLRLPKQATLERLGPEAAALWDLARDTQESVLRLESFRDPLELRQDFEHPIETLEPVLFIINRILEQLASRLRLTHRVASTMHLRLLLENAAPYERHFCLPAPTRDEAVLLRVLQTHLETLTLESPLLGVCLKIHETLQSNQQLALFETPLKDPNRFGETLARLHALAGENRVGVPQRTSTYKPGAFYLLDPCATFAPAAQATGSLLPTLKRTPISLRGIPMRRFRPAIIANVCLKQYRPQYIDAGHLSGAVIECQGPYRLSGEWWEETAWRREEWDVELAGTAHGLYRLVCEYTPHPVWSVEGCYDARL
jgi:protein ImuB